MAKDTANTAAAMFSSWVTTLLGVVTAAALVLPELLLLVDGDAATAPNLQLILTALGIGGLGVAAKDGNKSSEDVGL